jgi:hypothetical protein
MCMCMCMCVGIHSSHTILTKYQSGANEARLQKMRQRDQDKKKVVDARPTRTSDQQINNPRPRKVWNKQHAAESVVSVCVCVCVCECAHLNTIGSLSTLCTTYTLHTTLHTTLCTIHYTHPDRFS